MDVNDLQKGAKKVLNAIIYPGDKYYIAIIVNKIPYPLWLVEELSYDSKKQVDVIYKVGSEEPIGVKTRNATYSASMTIEAGYLDIILKANLYSAATQIKECTISVITFAGTILKVYEGCWVTSSEAGIKAKDKRSLVKLNFEATSII
jgi:hypothetical protein